MTIAFFYQNPAVLNRDEHRQLRIKPFSDARFAEKSMAAPLVVAEFPEACLEYPIVFVRNGDEWSALAVTGLANDENLFVDADGKWAGNYVPASVRRYPFILADNGPEQPGQPAQLSVAIDMGSANVGDNLEGGEALFDDAGEPAAALKRIIDLLADFQGQIGATQAFIARLDAAGLLVETNMDVKTNVHLARLSGVYLIDEARLRQLPDATAAAWFRSGELALVYAHMLSLRNLVPLLARRKTPVASEPDALATGESIH